MVALCLLLAASPGTRIAVVHWNGAPQRTFIDLGVVILKAAGPGAPDRTLEQALDLEALRLRADAFVFEQATLETVYVPERHAGVGEHIANAVLNIIVQGLASKSPSNAYRTVGTPGMWPTSAHKAHKEETKKGFFRAIRYATEPERAQQQPTYDALTKAFLDGQMTVADYDAKRAP